jgi:hypothetical protein
LIPQLMSAEMGGLSSAVAALYRARGLPTPDRDETEQMDLAAMRLPDGLGPAMSRLIDALALHEELLKGAPEVAPGPVLESTLTIAREIDSIADILERTETTVLSESGMLFQDPLGLVLVGDAGPTRYVAGGKLAATSTAGPVVLIVDTGGDDTYDGPVAGAGGSSPLSPCNNGVAAAVVVEAAGDDTYRAQQDAVGAACQLAQGAGANGGVGVLLDLAGNDTYEAVQHVDVQEGHPSQVVQGAGFSDGIGILVDRRGKDAYLAARSGSNLAANVVTQLAQGAGRTHGFGVLVDAAGADAYRASYEAQHLGGARFQLVQGAALGSLQSSVGMLLDLGGDDQYAATADEALEQWAQGAGDAQAFGALVDEWGNDQYHVAATSNAGTRQSAQGSASRDGGHGMLIELDGDDDYEATSTATGLVACDSGCARQRAQGAAEFGGVQVGVPTEPRADLAGPVGVLLDAGGNDRYEASMSGASGIFQVAQGAGMESGVGLLIDRHGNDEYHVDQSGAMHATQVAQGGGEGCIARVVVTLPLPMDCVGFLMDASGDDRYEAIQTVPADATQDIQGAGRNGVGLLLDVDGYDSYVGGPGSDGSVWSQGTGAGVDL